MKGLIRIKDLYVINKQNPNHQFIKNICFNIRKNKLLKEKILQQILLNNNTNIKYNK